MLSKKAGYRVDTPAGASRLVLDIESVTGEHLGLNTIKRITGILAYNNSPREATLDIIARYLGYDSWLILSKVINNKVSYFGTESSFIDLNDLPPGAELSFSWEPDRTIRIRHIGEGRYRVIEAENSKLISHDILTLSQIAEGFPLVVKEVERDGKKLGPYMGATPTGIKNIIFY